MEAPPGPASRTSQRPPRPLVQERSIQGLCCQSALHPGTNLVAGPVR